MKSNFCCAGYGTRHAALLSILLLSACASNPQVGSPTGAQPGHRQSATTQQPAARQRPVPVESKQPVPGDQVDRPPKKREHNIEED